MRSNSHSLLQATASQSLTGRCSLRLEVTRIAPLAQVDQVSIGSTQIQVDYLGLAPLRPDPQSVEHGGEVSVARRSDLSPRIYLD
jgi:hypothetical protein